MESKSASLIICNDGSKIIKEIKGGGNIYYTGSGEQKISVRVKPANRRNLIDVIEANLDIIIKPSCDLKTIQSLAQKLLTDKDNNYAYGMGSFDGKYYYHWIFTK